VEKFGFNTYQVFVQYKEREGFVNVGSLRAPNPELALDQAKEVYTRRDECIDFFVVPTEEIYGLAKEKANLLKISAEKEYRKPGYFSKMRRKMGEAN
jgi:ring-1,2-phenylacetyl-CoA epoxidase subunit PaaB